MRRAKVTPSDYISEDDDSENGLFGFIRVKLGIIDNEVLKWITVDEKDFISKRYKDTAQIIHISFKNESSSKLKAIQSYGRDAGYLIIGTTVTKSIISNQYTKIKENKQELSISKETTRASQLQSSKITSAVLKSSLTDTPEFKDNNVRARRNHLSIEDTSNYSNSEESRNHPAKKETARTRRVCIIT